MSRSETNQQTIAAYNVHIDEYVAKDARDQRTAVYWPGIQQWLSRISGGETIFEIGSGTGSDARRIEAAGYRVQRSDAAEAFVKYLQESGQQAVVYDVLDGPTSQSNAAILANAVLLHLTAPEMDRALRHIRDSMVPGGQLCVGLKLGDFEGWRGQGLSGKRYFKFWQVEQYENVLRHNGFAVEPTYQTSDGTFAIFSARKHGT